jgi:hypothetical protein
MMFNRASCLWRMLKSPMKWMSRMSSQRASRNVNSIATIEGLRLKPSSLSRMAALLCRMVAMLIVRPTLSSYLASLEANFVHGY